MGRNRWYRQAKATKRGERGGRESQRLIVPLSRGNRTEGPWGGKETTSHAPWEGNTAGPSRPDRVSPQRLRIARLATAWDEEPDALIARVRIRGGPGWATTQVYPATSLEVDPGRLARPVNQFGS